MRKLIAGMKISVDGKIEAENGADWVEAWSEDYGLTKIIVDAEFDRYIRCFNLPRVSLAGGLTTTPDPSNTDLQPRDYSLVPEMGLRCPGVGITCTLREAKSVFVIKR